MKNDVTCRSVPTPQALAGMPGNTPVLLALSGGADSRALLHLLVAQRRECDFPLLLAHVDHGIRGSEAARDREFCRDLARHYGLELRVLEADVPALAEEHGRGLEEEAREVRYAFFAELMEECNIPLLATAHHGDDHLETVLFHLSRGSGLKGLCGIAPLRPFGKGFLTRPLLGFSRGEILAYCEEQGLEFVTDSTNGDLTYARNRIRTEVIPVMEELFSHPQERVWQMSCGLREDEDYLEGVAAECAKPYTDATRMPVSEASQWHPAIRKRVWMRWIPKHTGFEIGARALEQLNRAVEENSTDARVALCGGFVATVDRQWIRLLAEEPAQTQDFRHPFLWEGGIEIPTAGLRIDTVGGITEEKIHNSDTTTRINLHLFSDIMDKDLYWRSRSPGDVILMGGMHRKVRKLYNAKAVPPRLRERLPMLCDGEGILWAPYLGWRDGARPQGENGYTVTLLLEEEY